MLRLLCRMAGFSPKAARINNDNDGQTILHDSYSLYSLGCPSGDVSSRQPFGTRKTRRCEKSAMHFPAQFDRYMDERWNARGSGDTRDTGIAVRCDQYR